MILRSRQLARIGAVCAGAAFVAAPAGAETPQPDAVLRIELNAVVDADNACRLSFLVENGLGTDLTSLVLETVVFTKAGAVERLTLFDFQALPAGRPRVRQFDLGGASCAGIGSLLINGVDACEGDGLEPNACQSGLVPESRVTGIEVQG